LKAFSIKITHQLSLFNWSLPHKIRFQLLQHRILLAQVTDHLALFQQHNSILVAYKFCEGSYFFPSQNS
jgi:hypothetical protein